MNNSFTALSRSLQTSDTADLENDVPQSVSMTRDTFRIEIFTDDPFVYKIGNRTENTKHGDKR